MSGLCLLVPGKRPGPPFASRVSTLASCICKFLTSSPDSGASWVIMANWAGGSSGVPATAGHLLTSVRSFARPRIHPSMSHWWLLRVKRPVPSTPWFSSGTLLSLQGDCTPCEPGPSVLCTEPPVMAPTVLATISLVSPWIQSAQVLLAGFLQSVSHCPPIQAPLRHAESILTSPQIRYIYQCQIYTSISDRVGVGGITTICGIQRNVLLLLLLQHVWQWNVSLYSYDPHNGRVFLDDKATKNVLPNISSRVVQTLGS